MTAGLIVTRRMPLRRGGYVSGRSASLETVGNLETNVHQLQVLVHFLEELTREAESEDERELCRALAQEYRLAASTYNRHAKEAMITPESKVAAA